MTVVNGNGAAVRAASVDGPEDGRAADARPAEELAGPGGGRPSERVALVFVPGLARAWGDASLDGVARRIARALNRQTVGWVFGAEPGRTQEVGQATHRRLIRIVELRRRAVGDGAVAGSPVVDVYGVDYARQLVARVEGRNVFVRAWIVLVSLVLGFGHLWRVEPFKSRPKNRRQRFQLFLGLAILGLYSFALVSLFVAAGTIVLGWIAESTPAARTDAPPTGAPLLVPTATPSDALAPTPPPATPVPEATTVSAPALLARYDLGPAGAALALLGEARAFVGRLVASWGPSVVTVGALLWAALARRVRPVEALNDAATDFVTMDMYFRAGVGQTEVAGPLEDLLDYLRDGEAPRYGRIVVAGNSFGSIVALDTLFPRCSPPPQESALRAVDALVTIGCPADMVRTIWPEYFNGRPARQPASAAVAAPPNGAGRRLAWLNILSPTDILASRVGHEEPVEAHGAEGSPPEDGDGAPPVGRGAAGGRWRNLASLLQTGAEDRLTPGARDRISLLDHLTLVGLREHGTYWRKPVADGDEQNCFDVMVEWLLATELLRATEATAPAEAVAAGR